MKNLLGALLKAQQDFPVLITDATNPAYRSRYATLSAVQEVAFPVLHKHGLVVLQSVRTEVTEKGIIVFVGAMLHHVESGEETFQELGMLPARQDAQGVGSAITYGRRYLLMTMLGLVADDDDGNAASRAPLHVAQNGAASRLGPADGRPVRAVREAPLATGKGKKGATETRPDWQTVPEAIGWGMEQGAFDDETSARAELRNVLQKVYPGRESCKSQELPPVLDGWYTEVQRRLAAKKAA